MSTLATLRTKADALGKLVRTDDDEYRAFMNTYGTLFSDSPENTRADYDRGAPMVGYKQGSSTELAQYYKIIHLMCTLGSVEKMYMPPMIDASKSVKQNQLLLEREYVTDLGLDGNSRVLDLGCGCGAIASHISALSGCTIHGVNIDESQIKKAWETTDPTRLTFSVGDFNQPLPFDDESFDAVYNIQALTYATDLEATLREAFRVLKPGGRMATNDVAALDPYDAGDDRHRELIQHTRELTAFGGFWHYRYWEDAFTNAGFTIESSAGRPATDLIRKERALYDRYNDIGAVMSKLRLIPRKVDAMLQRMNTNCDSYIEAEELGLLTLNWKIVASKPA